MYWRCHVFFILLCSFPAVVWGTSLLPSRTDVDGWLKELGDNNQFDPALGIDWGIVPGPFYTPELGLGIGAAVAGIYRPDASDKVSQNSTLSLSSYVSSTEAFGLALENRSFFSNDQWRIFTSAELDDTPTYYWGNGFTSGRKEGDKQKYTSQNFSLKPDVLYRIAPDVYFGLGWSLSSVHATDIAQEKGSVNLQQQVGGVSVLSSGASMTLAYDTRDFVSDPQSGQLMELRYTQYSPDFGSDTRFNQVESHYSSYYALNLKTVLAWEWYGQFTQGCPPWNMLPELGDSHRMRGYYQGRYRDRNVVSTQLEYRRQLDWRNGVVGWLGTGTMSPRPGELGKSSWLPSVGTGYRFEFKPRMNVRLDYGVGKGSSGFYFQVGEAF